MNLKLKIKLIVFKVLSLLIIYTCQKENKTEQKDQKQENHL